MGAGVRASGVAGLQSLLHQQQRIFRIPTITRFEGAHHFRGTLQRKTRTPVIEKCTRKKDFTPLEQEWLIIGLLPRLCTLALRRECRLTRNFPLWAGRKRIVENAVGVLWERGWHLHRWP